MERNEELLYKYTSHLLFPLAHCELPNAFSRVHSYSDITRSMLLEDFSSDKPKRVLVHLQMVMNQGRACGGKSALSNLVCP